MELLPTPKMGIVEIQRPHHTFRFSAPEQDITALKLWIRNKESDKTQRAYVADIQRLYSFLKTLTPPKYSLQQVTLEDLQDYKDYIATLDLSIPTQARILASTKSAFTFMKEIGFIPFNPGAALKLPKGKETIAQRILSESQVLRMLALEENPRNHAILTILYGAGLRAAELCVLKWEDLQPRGDTGVLVIYGKRKKTRYVLLKDSTWQELISLRKNAPDKTYIFLSRQENSRKGMKVFGRKLDESQILHIVREAAKRAKIPKWQEVSPHWLRHAHATHALDNGATISLVQATLGHESIETTGKYLHISPDKSSAQYLKI